MITFTLTADPNTRLICDDDYLGPLLATYGDLIGELVQNGISLDNDEIAHKANEFNWDYRNPYKYRKLISMVPLPVALQSEVAHIETPLDKGLVHKREQGNVLLSDYCRMGMGIAFKGRDDWQELHSDHVSDHVDGIKIFEIIRQATLASFHINGLHYDSAVALTDLHIEYIRYVELSAPYIIFTIPVNREDGGAMFTLFGIYQLGKLAAQGYLATYTFRSKEAFSQKREVMKAEAATYAG